MDPKVAADVLVKVELEDSLVSTPDVCFVAKDEWCATRTTQEVAGSCFFQRFVLPRDSDGRVPLEILETILAEVKVEEVEAAESLLEEQGEELDLSAFNSYPFPVDPLSSQG